MGCDIHLHTEKRKTINDETKWVNCDNWQIDHYEGGYGINPIYNCRNYRLFSILADVRNDAGNEPICQPRGLPSDVSETVKKESDDWGVDGHSHSWLTLKEVKDYLAKHPLVKYNGLMTPENAALVDAGEMPEMWCKGTNQSGYAFREWEYENRPLQEFVKLLNDRKRDELWIFSDENDTPESDAKFRIVFWFDN